MVYQPTYIGGPSCRFFNISKGLILDEGFRAPTSAALVDELETLYSELALITVHCPMGWNNS